MAHTARSGDDTRELFDDDATLQRKVRALAGWLRAGQGSAIAFTGAGISTSAGIPDFRSGMGTSLATGPGVWELRAAKQARSKKHKKKTRSSLKAMPTATHMALRALCDAGTMRGVVSQNTDGLHVRSGLRRRDNLLELHGNTKLEHCPKCGAEYFRDFHTRSARKVHNHRTGRPCERAGCSGMLCDSIINFGENLPEDMIDAGFAWGAAADVCLVLGSSLTVTPAADIAAEVGRREGARLVIVNLQPTPLDAVAALRINGKCDDVMRLLMAELATPIPRFLLQRRVRMSARKSSRGVEVHVAGIDVHNKKFSFMRNVSVKHKGASPVTARAEPFCARLPLTAAGQPLSVTLCFYGHYNEPPVVIAVPALAKKPIVYALAFDPTTGVWDVELEASDASVGGVATSVARMALSAIRVPRKTKPGAAA